MEIIINDISLYLEFIDIIIRTKRYLKVQLDTDNPRKIDT